MNSELYEDKFNKLLKRPISYLGFYFAIAFIIIFILLAILQFPILMVVALSLCLGIWAGIIFYLMLLASYKLFATIYKDGNRK